MAKLIDITTKVYQHHLDGKTCACILHGSQLGPYFDVDAQFDESDRAAALDFIEHQASPQQKNAFHLWFQLILQLRNQFNVTDVSAQALLQQLTLRTCAVKALTEYLKQAGQRLNAPRVFDTQAKAKAYLVEREALANQAIHQTAISLNQWLKQCFKDIEPSKQHQLRISSAEALYGKRYQAWHRYCEEHFSEPRLGETFNQLMARREQDPHVQSLVATLSLTRCYQEIFGDEFMVLMKRAASTLRSLVKKHPIDPLPASGPSDGLVGITVKSLARSPWLTSFIAADGFSELYDACCETVSLGALAQANIEPYVTAMQDESKLNLQCYWPSSHRQSAVVSVRHTHDEGVNFYKENDSEFPLPILHQVPALFMALSNDAYAIKQVKASLVILARLSKLTGLGIDSSKLFQVDQALMIAYQGYNQTRQVMCNLIDLYSLESIATKLAIDVGVVERYLDVSDYRAIQVPQNELSKECERWFDAYLSDGIYDRRAEAFNRIVKQAWRNVELFEVK